MTRFIVGLLLVFLVCPTVKAAPPAAVDDVVDEDLFAERLWREPQLIQATDGGDRYGDTGVLANGNFVHTWLDPSGDFIFARVISAAGRPVSPVIAVSGEQPDSRVFSPEVAPTPDGGFVVVWDTNPYPRMAFFDENGDRTRPTVTVATPAASWPDIALIGETAILIVWQELAGDGQVVKFRRYGFDGLPLSGIVTLAGSFRDNAGGALISAFPDGRYVVAWTDNRGQTLKTDGRHRFYRETGGLIGSEQTPLANAVWDHRTARAVPVGDGYVAMWTVASSGSGPNVDFRVLAQLYATDGEPIGEPFALNDPDFIANIIDITRTAGGGFMVLMVGVNEQNEQVLVLRQFDSEANLVSDTMPFRPLPSGIAEMRLVTLGDDRYALTYDRVRRGAPPSSREIGRDIYNLVFAHPALIAGQTYTLNPLANDDTGGLPTRIHRLNGIDVAPGEIIRLPSGATVSTDGQTLSFDLSGLVDLIAEHEPGYHEIAFEYGISNADGSSSATFHAWVQTRNDPPTPQNDQFLLTQDQQRTFTLAELVANDSDPDDGHASTLQLTDIANDLTGGAASLNEADQQISYDTQGRYDALPVGETAQDRVAYEVTDIGGASATAEIEIEIVGLNDPPSIRENNASVPAGSGFRDITSSILDGIVDPDDGDTFSVIAMSPAVGGTLGLIGLQNGMALYNPDEAFPDLAAGETAQDRFNATIQDAAGATVEGEFLVTVRGGGNLVLQAGFSGLGAGEIRAIDDPQLCSAPDICELEFRGGSAVSLETVPGENSRFAGWQGGCDTVVSGTCHLTMTGDRSVIARFDLTEPPEGRIFAATLPAARGGHVGGPPITAFMTVLSRQATPAQNCRILAPDERPFGFDYTLLDATNQPTGEVSAAFNLPPAGLANFVIEMRPIAPTPIEGFVFQPSVVCENAELQPIDGVNSIRLLIEERPAMDLLTIGATPSGDGVIRVPRAGGTSFISLAAVNIGGQFVYPNTGTRSDYVNFAVDTGGADLPLTFEVCQTDAAGVCLHQRTIDNTNFNLPTGEPRYMAVFVRSDPGEEIRFDPANARVYIRATDGRGAVHSVFSAAVTVPPPD